MAYWLVKTEPTTYSIDDLKRDKVTQWHGVRNYQARNLLREMKVGDRIFVYHSSSDPIGIAGIAEVSREAYADPTQFDSKSDYFDVKATKAIPRWFCPDVKFVDKFTQILTLENIRSLKGLSGLVLLQRGSRLSVQPVSTEQYAVLCRAVENQGVRTQTEKSRLQKENRAS